MGNTPTIDLSSWASASFSDDDQMEVVDQSGGTPVFTQASVGALKTYLASTGTSATASYVQNAVTASLAITSSYIVFATASGIVSKSSSGSGQGNATLFIQISGSSYYINLYNTKV